MTAKWMFYSSLIMNARNVSSCFILGYSRPFRRKNGCHPCAAVLAPRPLPFLTAPCLIHRMSSFFWIVTWRTSRTVEWTGLGDGLKTTLSLSNWTLMMAWVAPLSIIMDGNSPYPCIPSVTRKSSLEFYVERDPEGVAKKEGKKTIPPYKC